MDKKADIHEPPAGTKCDCGNNEFTRDNRYDRWYCGLCRMVFLSESDKNPKMDKKAETPDTLEQAAAQFLTGSNTPTDFRQGYVQGAKFGAVWQQKHSFSLEDARRIWEDGQDCENPDTEKQIAGEWKKSWTFDQFMQENFPEKP